MYTDIIESRLTEVAYTYLFRQENKDNAKDFVTQFLKDYNNRLEILNIDLSKLNDEDFLDILKKSFYNFDIRNLGKEDFINIYSMANNKNYFHSMVSIPTNMVHKFKMEEGRGRDFRWWTKLMSIRYNALVSNDIKIDYNRRYSALELQEMIDKNNIILLNIDLSEDIDFDQQEYVPLECQNLEECANADSKNFHHYVTYLREKFSRKKILKDAKQYLILMEDEIQQVLYPIKANNCNDRDYEEIAFYAKETLENTPEYQEFKKLLLKYKLDSNNKKEH